MFIKFYARYPVLVVPGEIACRSQSNLDYATASLAPLFQLIDDIPTFNEAGSYASFLKFATYI